MNKGAERIKLFNSIPELTEHKDTSGRVSYRYKGIRVVYEIRPNTGNGYIRGKDIEGKNRHYIYFRDPNKGISIADMSEGEIRALIRKVMDAIDDKGI